MPSQPALLAIARIFFGVRIRTLSDCTRQHRAAQRRDVIRRRRLLGLRP